MTITEQKKLLLLGILLNKSMHGYALSEKINHLDRTVTLKPANAYRILADMENEGYISSIEKKIGNRPIRINYDVTHEGKIYFETLLRSNLAEYVLNESVNNIGLQFIHWLPESEIANLLTARRNAAAKKIASLHLDIRNNGATYALDYLTQQCRFEIEWLDAILSSLTYNIVRKKTHDKIIFKEKNNK